MRRYFSISFLELNKGQSLINKAFVKYGYSSFKLEIIEYCAPEKAIIREQYYLDLLQPEYNILKKAGFLLGFKHSKETKTKLSAISKSRALSPENLERFKILSTRNERSTLQAKRLEQLKIQVFVLDSLNNETIVYPSITEAAQVIGCDNSTIGKALKHKEKKGVLRLIKKRYVISFFKEKPSLGEDSTYNGVGQGSNKHRVEIVDTLNGVGNITVYPSIRQAAKAMCTCDDP